MLSAIKLTLINKEKTASNKNRIKKSLVNINNVIKSKIKQENEVHGSIDRSETKELVFKASML